VLAKIKNEDIWMKWSLKVKLIISYGLLALFIISALLFVSNYVMEERFQTYVIENQDRKNKGIVDALTREITDDGGITNLETVLSIGESALNQGVIVMLNDKNGNEIYCMSTYNMELCDDMLTNMMETMKQRYPDFEGEYQQISYPVIKNGEQVATITLGFYGPFYYQDEEIEFLTVLNRLFVWIGLICLLVAGVIGYLLSIHLVRPINKVINKAKKIEEGNYGDRIQIDSKTKEMNQLLQSINSLAETLEQKQVEKKRLAADYAHEFRTPLTTLQSNLEAMIDHIFEPTTDRLESCREEVLRLSRMISDLDQLVTMETKPYLLEKDVISMNALIKDVLKTYHLESKQKQVEFIAGNQEIQVIADRDKLFQVVSNLFLNAIKYTNENGKIEILVEKTKEKVLVIMKDDGIGIEEVDCSFIFESLYRTDRSRSRDTGGSGIGLSVAKAIVLAHGGDISVKSKVGEGSEFVFWIPVHDKERY
jgi:two-component system, OmpR family, sensor histidine kinase BaeS